MIDYQKEFDELFISGFMQVGKTREEAENILRHLKRKKTVYQEMLDNYFDEVHPY